MLKKNILPPIFGVIFFICYIIFASSISDFRSVLQGINGYIYFAAIAFSILDLVFFTLSWKKLVNFLKLKMSFAKALLYVLYSIYIDILIPVESTAEVTRTFLISRRNKGSGESIASVVLNRFINTVLLTVLLMIVCISYSLWMSNNTIVFFTVAIITIQIAIISAIVSFTINETLAIRLVCRIAKFVTRITKRLGSYEELKQKIEVAGHEFRESILKFIHSPKTILIVVFYSVLAIASYYTMTYLIFLSIGYEISPLIAVFSTIIINAIYAIPIYFEFGLPEITMTGVYFWFGIPIAVVAVVTVLNRIITFWLRFSLGFVSYQVVEVKKM